MRREHATDKSEPVFQTTGADYSAIQIILVELLAVRAWYASISGKGDGPRVIFGKKCGECAWLEKWDEDEFDALLDWNVFVGIF